MCERERERERKSERERERERETVNRGMQRAREIKDDREKIKGEI